MATAEKVLIEKLKRPAPPKGETVQISAPNIAELHVKCVGISPLVQEKFSWKAKGAMMAKHMAGSQAAKGKTREKRDFDEDYKGAMHISKEGWIGINAASFRNAMISACRTVNFKMTIAKLSIFVEHDGLEIQDGTPLVRITKGEPERFESAVRNQTGVADIRCRPMWREWELNLRIKFDADQFSASDVANLLARAGQQVGVGAGRPDSKSSAGLGFGRFRVESMD